MANSSFEYVVLHALEVSVIELKTGCSGSVIAVPFNDLIRRRETHANSPEDKYKGGMTVAVLFVAWR